MTKTIPDPNAFPRKKKKKKTLHKHKSLVRIHEIKKKKKCGNRSDTAINK